jgi:DNA-binding LacI/PurR family transcriptional regulator
MNAGPTFIYQKLKDNLRAQIKSGELLPGEAVPPENTLAKKYGICRPSVRKALKELEDERLIIKKQGLGTFVHDGSQPKTDGIPGIIGIDLTAERISDAGWYYGDFIGGVKAACDDLKLHLALSDESNAGAALRGQIIIRYETWAEQKLLDLKKNDVPTIVINRFLSDPETSYLAVDYEAESFRAVEYLVKSGHRKIGIIGEGGPSVGRPRLAGYLRALEKHGISVDDKMIFVEDPVDKEHLFGRIRAFLQKSGASAYFLSSAYYGLNFVSPAVNSLGIRVPEDISLICFDDINGHPLYHGTALSCVRMPLREMGKRAAFFLAAGGKPALRGKVSAELIIRDSCGDLSNG